MDKNGEQQKEIVAIHANKLPTEIVGRFLQNLSIQDRLNTERVSPQWKRALEKWGWTEQRKLDTVIVFEKVMPLHQMDDWETMSFLLDREKMLLGQNLETVGSAFQWNREEMTGRFWNTALDDGNNCHFVSLLNRCSPWLRELDLGSFGRENIERFRPQITESLSSLTGLVKLGIRGLNLHNFVEHLPSTLSELKTSYFIGIKDLEVLSQRCPNLEEVPFANLPERELDTETVIKLIGKFPRQKKLCLPLNSFPQESVGGLASIGQLKALEELHLPSGYYLDGESLEAIVEGCQRLRSLSFHARELTERELLQLAKMPKLVALKVRDRFGEFTDAVLKAIAQRGQLKKLIVDGVYGEEDRTSLSDDSIVYLVDRCKSVVSLEFNYCPQITERSLEALIAEVHRRHGTPPRSLPSGPRDDGIFYFYRNWNADEHTWDRVQELVDDNPWIHHDHDYREII